MLRGELGGWRIEWVSGGPGVGGGLSGIFIKSRIGVDDASAPGSRGCSGASRSCSGPGREKSRGGPPGAPGSRGLPGHSRRSRAPSCNPALPGSGAPAPGAPGLRRSQSRGRLRALRYALPIHCLKPRPEPNPLHQLPPAAPIRSRGLFRGLPGRPGGRPSGGCPDAVPGLPEPPGAASPFPPPSQAPSGTPCARH